MTDAQVTALLKALEAQLLVMVRQANALDSIANNLESLIERDTYDTGGKDQGKRRDFLRVGVR